jgi:hypothetical protein
MSASSTLVPVTILYQVAPRSTRALPSMEGHRSDFGGRGGPDENQRQGQRQPG